MNLEEVAKKFPVGSNVEGELPEWTGGNDPTFAGVVIGHATTTGGVGLVVVEVGDGTEIYGLDPADEGTVIFLDGGEYEEYLGRKYDEGKAARLNRQIPPV